MRIKFNFVRMKFKIMRIKRESHAREILPFRPKGKKGWFYFKYAVGIPLIFSISTFRIKNSPPSDCN